MIIDCDPKHLALGVPLPPAHAGIRQDRSIARAFDDACERYAERSALIWQGTCVKYRQLARRVERLALHLHGLGLGRGDCVVTQLPCCPESVALFLALQTLGARPVPAQPSQRFSELSQLVESSRAVAYVVPARLGTFACAEQAGRLQQRYEHLRLVLVLGLATWPGHHCLNDLLETRSRLSTALLRRIQAGIDADAPALLVPSARAAGGGLLPCTHNDYLSSAHAAAVVGGLHPGDRLLLVAPPESPLPLASSGLWAGLLHGASTVLSISTCPRELLRLIEGERITHLELTPTLLLRMLNDPHLPWHDLRSLRVIVPGGHSLPQALRRQAAELLPGCVLEERGYFRAADHGALAGRHPGRSGRVQEIEGIIQAHPAVGRACCVVIPDPVLGEQTWACVIARTGQQAPTLQEICRWLALSGIARGRWPVRLALCDVFPLTRSGTVSKPQLIKRVLASPGRRVGRAR